MAPAELEDTLLGHPDIQDVCVIGVPDVESGEVPRAFVVIKQDREISEKAIVDFIKGTLISVFGHLKQRLST